MVVTLSSRWIVPDGAPQLDADLGVERAERLVEQQHLGLVGQRPGQRHPLLLAARELRAGMRRAEARRGPTSSKQLVAPPPPLRCRHPADAQGNSTFSATGMWRNSA